MPKRNQRGFNLIELMLVIVIAAIMAGIGVPSFREFIATQRVKNTAFDFAASLLQARSEAIKRNASVSLAQAGGSWGDGWTVNVGGATLSTKEASSVTVTPSDAAITSISFQGNGRLAATTTVRFQFADPKSVAVRCVSIGTSGVPNTTNASCP